MPKFLPATRGQGGTISGFISDSPLSRDLIRIGEGDCPRRRCRAARLLRGRLRPSRTGGDVGFKELRAYFASLRAAFSDLRIVRERIIADGIELAARTTFSGNFTSLFTDSPIGSVEPTGRYVEWEVIGTFRFHDDGRLAEEWVQSDYRSFLSKLGVTQVRDKI